MLTGGLVVLGYLLSRSIIGAVHHQPQVIELAQTLLHIMLWSTRSVRLAAVFSATMRASGTVLVPTLHVDFRDRRGRGARRRLFSAIASASKASGSAYPVAFCAMMALQMSYYRLVWRKRAVADGVIRLGPRARKYGRDILQPS